MFENTLKLHFSLVGMSLKAMVNSRQLNDRKLHCLQLNDRKSADMVHLRPAFLFLASNIHFTIYLVRADSRRVCRRGMHNQNTMIYEG